MTRKRRQSNQQRNARKRAKRYVRSGLTQGERRAHSALVNAIVPWTNNPTAHFTHNPSFYNRQVLFLPGEGIAPITTDANGQAAFAFQPAPGGQFCWVSNTDTAISTGTWTPDWTAAAHDLISTSLSDIVEVQTISAGFEFIPATALTAQGGYILASKYDNKNEAAGIGIDTVYPGHDQMYNLREPLTYVESNHFVPGLHTGQSGFATEVGDTTNLSGAVSVLRFHGPASTLVGYVHMRMVVEAVLDPSHNYGHRPPRHANLQSAHSAIRSSIPTFFQGTKEKAISYISKHAMQVVSHYGVKLLEQGVAAAAGMAAGVLTENPAATPMAYSSVLALENAIIPDVD